MQVIGEDKISQVQSMVNQLDEVSKCFTELLEGFEIYNNHKGSLNISVYEAALALYECALKAMEEQISNMNIHIKSINKLLS